MIWITSQSSGFPFGQKLSELLSVQHHRFRLNDGNQPMTFESQYRNVQHLYQCNFGWLLYYMNGFDCLLFVFVPLVWKIFWYRQFHGGLFTHGKKIKTIDMVSRGNCGPPYYITLPTVVVLLLRYSTVSSTEKLYWKEGPNFQVRSFDWVLLELWFVPIWLHPNESLDPSCILLGYSKHVFLVVHSDVRTRGKLFRRTLNF
jgi:hypothetical protein